MNMIRAVDLTYLCMQVNNFVVFFSNHKQIEIESTPGL